MDYRWSVLFVLWIVGAVAAPPREVLGRADGDCDGESCTEDGLLASKSTESVPSDGDGTYDSVGTSLESTLQPEFISSTSSNDLAEDPAAQPALQNAPSLFIENVASVNKEDNESGNEDQHSTPSESLETEDSSDPSPSADSRESENDESENKESLETHEKPLIVPGDSNGDSESSHSPDVLRTTSSVARDTDKITSVSEESTLSDKNPSVESESVTNAEPRLRAPGDLLTEGTSPSSTTGLNEYEKESSTKLDELERETSPEFSSERLAEDDFSGKTENKESPGATSSDAKEITDKSDATPLDVHDSLITSDIASSVGSDVTRESTIDSSEGNHALGIMEEKAADIKTHNVLTSVENLDDASSSSSEDDQEDSKDPDDKYIDGTNRDLVAAVQFLHYDDKESSEQCNKLVNAHWNYATNLTEHNKQKQITQTLEFSRYHKEAWKNATSFAWKSFNDTVLRRWFKKLSILGNSALSEEKLEKLHQLEAEMEGIYSMAKICSYKANASSVEQNATSDCNVPLDPDLTRILAKSRNYDELLHVWKAWRDAAGKPIREKYWEFIQISNEAARKNGFKDSGEMWKEPYESQTFEHDLKLLWEQLRPLYENLHAYVRRKLISRYGSDKINDDGPIPAHLLGNMWAQSWGSLMDIVQPYPGKPSVDITPTMKAKNMTALQMFQISEEFFTSLGLKPMPEKFWNNSMIEKPKDREVICHASAWDFCNGEDFRIKQCTDITMDDLVTVHHEMGHIQYYLQYAKQPNVFREGANPGFHEAIGDVLALSVATPKHLHTIGLLSEIADDPEGDLNFLMSLALEKAAFLPFGYLIDNWRWGVFSGDIKKEEMNRKWWELRLKYQGVCPPVLRTENDFDPGAKYHVPGNTPYIRYFVSSIIQFQMHKSLCDASGHTGPLHKCDIYRSKAAGQILSDVMELGSSEPWSEAMKIMTGGSTDKMDAGPILEYFEPLLKYLKEQNVNETLGWKSDDPVLCPQ